jgi:hypothetical protein
MRKKISSHVIVGYFFCGSIGCCCFAETNRHISYFAARGRVFALPFDKTNEATLYVDNKGLWLVFF